MVCLIVHEPNKCPVCGAPAPSKFKQVTLKRKDIPPWKNCPDGYESDVFEQEIQMFRCDNDKCPRGMNFDANGMLLPRPDVYFHSGLMSDGVTVGPICGSVLVRIGKDSDRYHCQECKGQFGRVVGSSNMCPECKNEELVWEDEVWNCTRCGVKFDYLTDEVVQFPHKVIWPTRVDEEFYKIIVYK